MANTGINSVATIPTLEKETFSCIALKATLEKEASQTISLLTTNEIATQSPIGSLTDLEAPEVLTLSLISSLEKEQINNLATIAGLEKVGFGVFALLTDLVYVLEPTAEKITRLDQRENPKRPIAKARIEATLQKGQLSRTSRFNLNLRIRQVTFKTPDLDGGTAKIQIVDMIGAVLWESGDQAENTAGKLITSDAYLPACETIAVKIIVSKVQSSDVSFIVVLYGL